MLRETWANTSEFNYSKFSTLHAHLKGTYLPIDDRYWKNITVKYENEYSDNDIYSTVNELNLQSTSI